MRVRPLALALLAAALLAAGCGTDEEPPSSPSRAPSDGAATVEGGPLLKRADFDLARYDGDVVLLNFWATWCAPCRAEMPDLVALQEDLGPEGLQIVGVATDRQGREAVAPYLEQQPVNYPIVLDPRQEIGAEYGGMAALPTTLVIDRGGEVRQRIIGRVRPEPLRQRLKEVLADSSSDAPSSNTVSQMDAS